MMSRICLAGFALLILAFTGGCEWLKGPPADTNDAYTCEIKHGDVAKQTRIKSGSIQRRATGVAYEVRCEALKTKVELRDAKVSLRLETTKTVAGKTQKETKTVGSDAPFGDVLVLEKGKSETIEGFIDKSSFVLSGQDGKFSAKLLLTAQVRFPDDESIQKDDSPNERSRNKWKWEVAELSDSFTFKP